MQCPNCKSQIYNGEVFCPYCGYNLGTGASSQPQQGYSEQYFSQPQQQAPQYTAPQNSGGNNSNRVLVGIISAMTVLLLSSAFVLFVKPGYMLKRSDSSSAAETDTAPAVTSTTSANVSEPPKSDNGEEVLYDNGDKPILSSAPQIGGSEDSPAETTATTKKPKETTTTTKKPKETTTTAPTTTKPAETTAPKQDDDLERKNRAYSEAMAYSTYDRPSEEDFYWCFGQGGLIVSPSEEYAEMIDEPLGYSGGWKSMIIYNPTNSAGNFMREYDNVDIGIYEDSVAFTIDWYMYVEDFSEYSDLTDIEDTLLVGDLKSDGTFNVSGICDVTMVYFWKEDGKEYGLGQLVADDGIPAYIALVRP